MKGLEISEDLSLPLETVTSALVVYGGRGMGKTNLGGVLVEELARLGLRWVVADPVGVWWGLRHDKDGKGPGIECLILGGPHGDIPIEPTGGAVVADLVADESVNVIIDFSRKPNGEMWGVGEKIRFMTEYGKRLFQRQGSLVGGKRREPLMQVVDEAARFIPQTVRSGEAEVAKCMSIWAAIVEEGRNVGLGICLLTQRSARLSKDVAELADAMLAFRTIGPNSLDAVMDWLGEHVEKARVKELGTIVRQLPVGQCLVVSPGWLKLEDVVKIRIRHTFDSSATPKPGESVRRVVGSGAKPDLSKYAARMQETIERAKENDPAELRKKIKDLTTLIANRPFNVEVDREVEEEIKAAVGKAVEDYSASVKSAMVAAEKDMQGLRTKIEELAIRLKESSDSLIRLASQATLPDALLPATYGTIKRTSYVARPRTPADVIPTTPTVRRGFAGEAPVARNGDVSLNSGARRMLGACAAWAGKGLTEGKVAAMSGLKRTTGTFSTYKSSLVSAGLIRVEGGLWFATDKGLSIAGVSVNAAPRTTDEVLAIWRPKIGGGAQRMLDVLIRHRGHAISQHQLGEEANISSTTGTFSTYISALATAELIVKPERGMVAANKETLFLKEES